MKLGRYRKAIAVGLLGLVQLAAYIVADPRDLPPWVVTAAAAVNTLAVFWVRNDQPPRSRKDLIEQLPTRIADAEERYRRPPAETP